MSEERTLEEIAKGENGVEDFLLDRAKNTKESTLRLYAKKLGCLRKETSRPLLELSLREARQLAVQFSKRGDGSLVGTIAGMFYRFHDKEDLAKAFKIRQRFRRLSPNQILALGEVNDILKACDNLRDRALIALLWEAGCRIHEALALNLEDLSQFKNSEKPFLKVFFPKVKIEGEEHSCLLIESSCHIRAWLDSYPYPKRAGAPLFIIPSGKRLTYAGAAYSLRKIVKRLKMKKRVTAHTFRHSRATHLLRLGVSEAIIKKNLGWVPNSQMLARYSHLKDEDVDNILLEIHGHAPQKRVEAGGLIEATGDLGPALPIVTEDAALDLEDVDPDEVRILIRGQTFSLTKFMEELGKEMGAMVRDEVRKQVKNA